MSAPSARSLALFGTSADPPTPGHRALLAGLARRYGHVATGASDNPCKQHGAPLTRRADLLQAVADLQAAAAAAAKGSGPTLVVSAAGRVLGFQLLVYPGMPGFLPGCGLAASPFDTLVLMGRFNLLTCH